MTRQMLALAFMTAVAIGGVAWVFVYPLLSGERKSEKRRAALTKADPTAPRDRNQRSRREQVEETLKGLDERTKKQKKQPLGTRIAMAGLTWSKRQFMMISAGLGLFGFLVVFIFGFGPLPALAVGFSAAFGLPRWTLNFLKKRREKKFLEALPDAVDVIVRGIKAGLPLFDSIKVVVADAPDPLRTEFANIVETQTIGIPLGEACAKLYERMPVPEANFFGIVISIQQAAGGNLAEALGNLSKVLRDRKKMRAKIQAMSMEAKASAGIIGALPPIVMLLMWLTSREYVEALWLEPLGRVMLACCVTWMAIGIFVMKKMINFDF
jgi:tight adherence protein B